MGVYVDRVDGKDLSYWLKRLAERDKSDPVETSPFEVTETGWELAVQINLHFILEANEKTPTLWHGLKLHPYGPNAGGQRARKENIVSHHYEEIFFHVPSETLFELLNSGAPASAAAAEGRD